MVSGSGLRTVRYGSGCRSMVCTIQIGFPDRSSSAAALEQLSRQKAASNRHGEDVRETLKWLDEATSKYPHAVTLQGAEDYYATWSEVEKFVVPRTLFSEDDLHEADADTEPDVDGLLDEDMSKLTLGDVTRKTPVSSAGSIGSRSASPSSMRSQRSSVSALSPPTSPAKAVSPLVKSDSPVYNKAPFPNSSVPLRLQPLFNYILWRIHQEVDPVAALETFIFLCNDQSKVNYAKGFEIRTKRLEQLREAIGREDRDFRNRQMVSQRENPIAPTTQAKATATAEIVKQSPPSAPAAMVAQQQAAANIIDPDAFVRPPVAHSQPVQPQTFQPRSPRIPHVSPQASRGGQPSTPRGNPRGNFRGPRGRGNFNGQGRGGFTSSTRVEGAFPNGQIDPNSFTRPRGSGYTGRGGRKLWVPT